MSTLKTLKQLKPGDVVVYTDGRRREVKAVLPARQRGYIIVQFKRRWRKRGRAGHESDARGVSS
jgi:hypothetical protein